MSASGAAAGVGAGLAELRGTALGVDKELVAQLLDAVASGRLPPEQAWARLCSDVLRPEQPFELHRLLFQAVHAGRDAAAGPAPIWTPDASTVLGTNVAGFMDRFRGDLFWEARRTGDPQRDWPLLQAVSCQNPDVFWSAVLKELGLVLQTPPTRILHEDTADPDKSAWLPGARLNCAAAALQSPRVSDAGSPAIVWAHEADPAHLHSMSWTQLRQRCMHVAANVAARFQPGDALGIALPLSAEAVVLYLGVVLAGCVVVSIADSFAAAEVATRLRIANAKAVFTQDVVARGGKVLQLYSRVVGAPGVPTAIVLQGAGGGGGGGGGGAAHSTALRAGDLAWADFMACRPPPGRGELAGAAAGDRPLPHVVDVAAPSNILFSSGTTGEPKAIPWSHVTPLRCAVDGWSLQDIHSGDVVAWPTNLGWMMGPWLVYAALFNGATIAIFEGQPTTRGFGEFVAAARVNVLGLVPSIVKAWRASGCMAHLDWSSLRCFSSTGEASSPDDYHWLASRVAGYRPVIEYCGGTEIGGGFLGGCLLQPQVASAFSTPSLGTSLVLLTGGGSQSPHAASAEAVVGELALVPPLLGASQRLLNRDHGAVYWAGMPSCAASGRRLRRHGDEVERLPGGYYRALGRCDDSMNLGGIKVSSVELERVVAAHVPAVAEVAAVGAPAAGGGPEELHLFVVLRQPAAGADTAGLADLQRACAAAVKAHLNPLFKVERVLPVSSLPRTASNKVLRRELRQQAMARARL